jgi:hypothetical protein
MTTILVAKDKILVVTAACNYKPYSWTNGKRQPIAKKLHVACIVTLVVAYCL